MDEQRPSHRTRREEDLVKKLKARESEIERLKQELQALAAWQCQSCGARFAESVRPAMLDGVTHCSSCAKLEAMRRTASAIPDERGHIALELFEAQREIARLRLAIERALAHLPGNGDAAERILESTREDAAQARQEARRATEA